jgi:hypothetical protein
MFFSKFLALAYIASTTSNAFVVVSPSTATSRPSFNLGASTKRHDDERAKTNDNAVRNFAAVYAITCGLLFPSFGAFAESTIPIHALNDHAVLSSALDLSKAITTMDFSLPSSYDKISDPVASGKDELTSTIIIETGSKRSSASSESSSSKKKSLPKSSSSGLSLNKMIALPSSSSSGSSMKEEAAAALAERIAQRKSMEAEQAARDELAARERDANIKAAREEKIARRAAEQAEKAAAALAKEQEARYEGVTFVDTSMPKY